MAVDLEIGDIVNFKQDDDYYGIVRQITEPDKESKIPLNKYWIEWFDGEKPTWFYDYELLKVEPQKCPNIIEIKHSSREVKVIRKKSNS